jgi:predicted O-methyltransferase YrrM
MRYTGTADEIIAQVADRHWWVHDALDKAREQVPFIKREILRHEAAVLFALARDYDHDGAQFLEIGTAWGYSAAVMAEAASLATITTLNPKPSEFERAVKHLKPYENVTPKLVHSWDYLEGYAGEALDLIFVDGNHDQVERDLPWWDHLKPGGLMLFHDYSPDGSGRPCQQVMDKVDAWAASNELEPGVRVEDNRGIGMIGFYRV